MNQLPRFIKMTCFVCKERSANVRQIYNPHISDWELCEMPICEKCRREEEQQRE